MERRSRSTAALVLVAAAALVLGSLGTAAAAGLTAAQVRRIAAKVVGGKAPHLSVASAKEADDAKRLGGRPPAAQLDGAVSSFDTSGLNGGIGIPAGVDSATELRPAVTLVIPPGVRSAHVTAGASFIAGAESDVGLWYAVDSSCSSLSGVGYEHRVALTATPNISMGSLDVLEPLTGSHTFRLCANASVQSGAFNAYITVETAAAD